MSIDNKDTYQKDQNFQKDQGVTQSRPEDFNKQKQQQQQQQQQKVEEQKTGWNGEIPSQDKKVEQDCNTKPQFPGSQE